MTLFGLGSLRLGQMLFALACVVSQAQELIKEDDGSGNLKMLFQTKLWKTPNIHYSAGDGWTSAPGIPMTPSTYGGNYTAEEGWFQYDIKTSQLEFVFNDNNGVWDNNDNKNYLVQKAGTWAVVTKITEQPPPKPVQEYVDSAGYAVKTFRETNDRLVIELGLNNATELYGEDIKDLTVEVSKGIQDSIRVKIADKGEKRWQVPKDLYAKGVLGDKNFNKRSLFGKDSNLSFTYTKNPFTFTVTRKSDGYVLFDTSKLPLVLKDQYLQVATAVTEDISVYGFGESTHGNMRLNAGDRHTLWARDQGAMDPNLNLYGSHPYFLGINGKGQAHGVLLLNSNGMDMTFEEGRVVYQTLGGVLDFHILAGPTPADVTNQYTQLIGRPKLMPYWSYGFHQCRWGYKSAAHLREVVDKYAENKIPLDVIWADIDYMDKFYDFTLDPVNFTKPDMQKLLTDVHARGQKFVPIIDPGIPDDKNDYAYSKGIEMDVFIKDTKGKPYLGQVWPGPTVFPDFFHPKAYSYWYEQLDRMKKMMDYDGLWIDMNELANFCPGTSCTRKEGVACPETGSISKITTCCLECTDDGNRWDNPPFKINNAFSEASIYSKTISTSSLQYNGIRQYDSHNLYGFTEAIATNTAQEKLTGKRSFVLSRSTFPGSGAYAAHWTGDNAATWNDIQWSIPTILNFGLYGIPMVGSDICGFSGTSSEELCARWTALGAFYPFSRNHNNLEAQPQETYVWESVAAIGRKFIGLRYRLLPYIYTLGYQAHVSGLPIARALFFEFPGDATVRGSPVLDTQFMLGNALLVTPVLTKGATSVTGYLPAGTWYNIFDYSVVESAGQSVTWDVKLDDMPVHVRGGTIIPMHQPALTSVAAQATPFDLLVALPSTGAAAGQLYLDDGDDINGDDKSTIVEFRVESQYLLGTTFSSKVVKNNFRGASKKTLNKLVVLGVKKQPSFVLVNVLTRVTSFTYDNATQRLEIDVSKSNLKVADYTSIFWR
jgi:alpha-glucosidase (family GH31 glycosyl hydrolase)